jgi:hypothetical protein
MTGEERRKHQRITFEADLVVISGVLGELPGRSIDLCEQGMAALLPAELSPGEHVEVRFKVGDETLNIGAIVRYKSVFRYGLEFLHPLYHYRSDTNAACAECGGVGFLNKRISSTPLAFVKIRCPICGGEGKNRLSDR